MPGAQPHPFHAHSPRVSSLGLALHKHGVNTSPCPTCFWDESEAERRKGLAPGDKAMAEPELHRLLLPRLAGLGVRRRRRGVKCPPRHSGTPASGPTIQAGSGKQRPRTARITPSGPERTGARQGTWTQTRAPWGPKTPNGPPAPVCPPRRAPPPPAAAAPRPPLNLGARGWLGRGHYAGPWPAALGRRANLTFIWERPAAGARGAAIDRR